MFLLSYGEEAPVNSYKIHISDDEGTLWNNETVVASGSYDNPNTANRLITLETPVEGKYVGFEFSDLAVLPYYYTLKGAEGVNLMELGAYENALYKYSVNNDYFSNGKEQSVDGSSCTITISDTEQVNALLVDGVNYTISVNNTEISSYTGKKLLILPMSFTNTEIEISGTAVNAVRTYSAFERIKGDLNGDCVLNDSDLFVMKRVLLGLTELDGLLTDINGNTVIDICDLVALKKNQP